MATGDEWAVLERGFGKKWTVLERGFGEKWTVLERRFGEKWTVLERGVGGGEEVRVTLRSLHPHRNVIGSVSAAMSTGGLPWTLVDWQHRAEVPSQVVSSQ